MSAESERRAANAEQRVREAAAESESQAANAEQQVREAAAESESQAANAEQQVREVALESEREAANAEQQVREAESESAGVGERRRFFPVFVGVMGPPPPADGGPAPPPDRIVLVNPLTQGMVVLQGDPELVSELLSRSGGGGGAGSGGQPPASRASIEAMKMVEFGQEGEDVGECPVCLDELAGVAEEEEVTVVKEMPCRHRFHGQCIEKWLGMHGSCPVCRFRMPAEEEGDSKKDGGGDGGDEGEAEEERRRRRRRRREVWVTIAFSGRQRRDRQQGEEEAGDD